MAGGAGSIDIVEEGFAWPRLAVDVLFLLGLSALFAVYLIPLLDDPGLTLTTVGCTVAALVCLLLVPGRRRHPLRLFIALVVASSLIAAVSAVPSGLFLIPAGLFCLEAYGQRGWARTWLVPVTILLIVGAVASSSAWTVTIGATITLLSIMGWARGVRTQRRYRDSLLERLAVAERERDLRAERAVAEERTRIARDIHDLVSHSLAVVAVQAAGAERAFDRDPGQAREALGVISHTARDALAEMRAMLAVLRQGDAPAETGAPSPGLAQIEELATGMDDSGMPVRWQISGQAYRLAPGAELALYRVAQEALTNALKHGRFREGAEVLLAFGPEDVELEVRSTLSGPNQTSPGIPGAGTGQVGMRERLALYGGTLQLESDDRQYRVLAQVPRTTGQGKPPGSPL